MNTDLQNKITIDRILRLADLFKYKVFMDGNLNIWGFRSRLGLASSNEYTDIQVVFYLEAGKWVEKMYASTTHPGHPYLVKPMNTLGAGILMEGQVLECWTPGWHMKVCWALKQTGKMYLIRDFDRDTIPEYGWNKSVEDCECRDYPEPGNPSSIIHEFSRDKKVVLITSNGLYGIDNHPGLMRNNAHPMTVGVSSAGCQVIQDNGDWADYKKLFDLKYGIYKRPFSYTLIGEPRLDVVVH